MIVLGKRSNLLKTFILLRNDYGITRAWKYIDKGRKIRFYCFLFSDGQDPSKIYIVGHSLGSHIAGVAGKKVHELTGKLLGRITALDPAGPCFSNISPSGRLDKTDAEYVDVIHSNAGMLGLREPVGKRLFFYNFVSFRCDLIRKIVWWR